MFFLGDGLGIAGFPRWRCGKRGGPYGWRRASHGLAHLFGWVQVSCTLGAWLANFAKNPGTRNDLAGNRTGRAPKSHGGLTVPAYINDAPAYLLHTPPANAAKSAGRTWGLRAIRHPGAPWSATTPRVPGKFCRGIRKKCRGICGKCGRIFGKCGTFSIHRPQNPPHPQQNAAQAAALRAPSPRTGDSGFGQNVQNSTTNV